jgi:hypothetical protein
MRWRACVLQIALTLAGSALGALPAHALTVQHAVTHFREGRYELELEATLNASAAEVQRVLRDYTRYPQLDVRVIEAKVLEQAGDNELLLYTRVRACVTFICRTVHRVERVEERPNELTATALPERSDVKFGLTQSQWQSLEPHVTRIVYRTQIEPKFWVPRIGRRAMLNALRDATIGLLKQVELEAQQAEPPAMPPATPHEQ